MRMPEESDACLYLLIARILQWSSLHMQKRTNSKLYRAIMSEGNANTNIQTRLR